MAVIGFASVHGAPGTSTLALAAAHHWPVHAGRPAILVEADGDGGVIAARHGLSIQPGLVELAGAARLGLAAAELARYSQPMTSGVPVIVAHPAAEQASAALRAAAAPLAATLAQLDDTDVLVDFGRLRPGSPALAIAGVCEVLVVVVRCVAEDIVTLLTRLPALERIAPIEVALVGSAANSIAEVRATSGLTEIHPIAFDASAVQRDPAAARSRRSAWARSVSALSAHLAGVARSSDPVDDPADNSFDGPLDRLGEPGVDGYGGPSRPSGSFSGVAAA